MKLIPRHTKIVETIETPFGTVVRENYYKYPESESNLYMIGPKNIILWFAERPMIDDAYANSIRQTKNETIKCSSWKGFDCEIDLRTGKLLNSVFTK